MARLPKKKLRLPVGDEWDNLPQSIDEARARGLNRFMKNGEMYELRRSGTDAYPQGKSERVSSRKDNRGTEKRNLSEKIASPDPKVRKEANQFFFDDNEKINLTQAINNTKRNKLVVGQPRTDSDVNTNKLQPIFNFGNN